MKKILAVASGGGHWVQLMRLYPVFEGHDTYYAVTALGGNEVDESRRFVVTDANLSERLALCRVFAELFFILLKLRPDVVITTGAAPGFAAVFWGKLFRCKTIWIDSVANHDELSASGRYAKRFSDVWLTQWSHLTSDDGPDYRGRVL